MIDKCNNLSAPGDTISYTGSASVCGTSLLLEAPGSGPYKWQKDNVDIPGATSQTFLATVSGKYTVAFGAGTTPALTVAINPVPVAAFTYTNNVCSGTSVQFNGSVTSGTAPFTYAWTFGGGGTAATQNPSHTFTQLGCAVSSLSNTLVVKDKNGCTDNVSNSINIIQAPDVQVADALNFTPFSNCDNNPTTATPDFTITVNNISPSAGCITAYSLNWGDGTPALTGLTAASFPLTHTYSQLGAYNLVVGATGANTCTNSKTYVVANQSNPDIGIGTFGPTEGCADLPVNILITTWAANSPGTTYSLDFGDGNSLSFNHPINPGYTNDTVNHLYTTTSCPFSPTFPLRITATNACRSKTFMGGDIVVKTKPKAHFTTPDTVTCAGQNMCFVNTTIAGYYTGCNTNRNTQWDFGDPASGVNNTSVAENPCHVYATPGTYKVRLTTFNPCGTSSDSLNICVQSPPVPSFTATPVTGCSPFNVAFTNTSSNINQCGTLTTLWTVTKNSATCIADSSNDYVFISGTNASSKNPSIRFNNQGVYNVTLTLTNKCGPVTTLPTVITVNRKPEATITNLPVSICLAESISPTSTAVPCGNAITTYAWTFAGGTPATASAANAGTITYSTAGTKNISLTVTNGCGSIKIDTTVLVIQPTVVNAGKGFDICRNKAAVTLSGFTPAGGTWSGAGISGDTFDPLAAGDGQHILTYTVGSGTCLSTDTIQVNVDPIPTVIVNSAIICFKDTAQLTASGADSYSWSPGTGLSAVTGANVKAYPINTEFYTVTGITMAAGCSNTAVATVTVNQLPVVDAGASVTLCNQPIANTLTGFSPAGGIWSGDNVTPTGVYTPSGTGKDTLMYSYTDAFTNCSNFDTMIVTVVNPQTANAGNGFSICINDPIKLLTGFSPLGGTWSGNGMSGDSFDAAVAGSGLHILTYTFGAGTCLSTDTIQVRVNGTPIVNVNNAIICIGDTAHLTATGANTYTWSPATALSAVTGANVNAYPTGTTSYLVSGKDQLTGCVSTATSNVTVNPDAIALFTPPGNIQCPPFVIDNAAIGLQTYPGNNNQYQWFANNVSIGSGINFPGYTIANENDSVTIKLKTTSLFGCKNDSISHKFYTPFLPHPSFTASTVDGCGPLDVLLTNTTANISLFSYQWDFGNGQTSTATQPGTITFAPNPNFGDTIYTVKLSVLSSCDQQIFTVKIKVRSKPNAIFTPDKTSACSPATISFNNISQGLGMSYVWDFADGATLATTNNSSISHSYNTGIQRTYPVKLTASNSCGLDSSIVNILITPNTIKLDYVIDGATLTGCLPHTVKIINNTTGANLFKWNFGDGTTLNTTKNIDVLYHTYYQKGTFTISVQAINNCSDTSATRSIEVYQSPVSNFSATNNATCIGDLVQFTNTTDTATTYNWTFDDGAFSNTKSPDHFYTVPGDYNVMLIAALRHTNGQSCADTTIKTISVVDKLPGNFTVSNSSGQCAPFTVQFTNTITPSLTAIWDFGDGTTGTGDNVSHTYQTFGTYVAKLTVTVSGGCTYTSQQTITVAGPGGSLQYTGGYVCNDDAVRFEATVTNTDLLKWNFGDGVIITTTDRIVYHSYAFAGKYLPKVSLISNSGCSFDIDGIDTIKVDKVKAGFSYTQQRKCGYTIIQLTDTSHTYFGINNFQWDFGDGTIGVGKIAAHTYTTTGNYTIQLIIIGSSGCTDTISSVIAVKVDNIPDASIFPIASGCAGKIISFNNLIQSTDAVNITSWVSSTGLTGTGNSFDIKFSQAGTYNIRLIAGTIYNCYDTVSTTIQIDPTPRILASNDATICLGASVQLNATGANQYAWSPINGLSCNDCSNPIAKPLNTTPYIVTGTNTFGCRGEDTVVIKVIKPFDITASGDDSICVGQSTNLLASGAATYSWSPSAGLNSSTISNPIATPQSSIRYRVVGYDGFNCFTDTAFVLVGVGKYPIISLPADQVLATGTLFPLSATVTNGPIERWTWSPSTDLSCSNCSTPVANVKKNITYNVAATTYYGCTGYDTIDIKVFCEKTQVFVPNTFTPQGGLPENAVLMVRGSGIGSVRSFRVFNRWGQVVFERSNFPPNVPAFGWDGNINGKPAEPAVYVYTVEVVCDNGIPYTYKGNVTLIK